MDPEGLDPTTQVMVHFAYDLVEKNRWLDNQLKAQGKFLKRCQQGIDDQMVSLKMPSIYEKFPHKHCQ